MNWDRIEHNWTAFKVSACKQWERLSSDEIDATLGKRDWLISSIKSAYGIGSQEAEQQVKTWQGLQVEARQEQ